MPIDVCLLNFESETGMSIGKEWIWFEMILPTGNVLRIDSVLGAIGKHFGLDSLQIVKVTTSFLSNCKSNADMSQIHFDMDGAGRSLFNIFVPVHVSESGVGNGENTLPLQLHHNIGALIGGETLHGTADCDYRGLKDIHLSVIIYIAQVNEENAY